VIGGPGVATHPDLPTITAPTLPAVRRKIEDDLCGYRGGQLLDHRDRAATVSAMREDGLEIGVTFDSARGYIASAPELRTPVVALSLGGLRRRIEALLLPDDPIIVLQLDALAERERHRRRAMPPPTRTR
jgi:hypothetical protein